MRVRWAAQHDGLVVWIQELLTDIARDFGEEAVLESVTLAYEHLWKPRYARWADMTPEERLQLSVEGMRGGHLSGPRHRGDVGVSDEGDRYVMSLDPCGSCGILRRGDPDSGRPSHQPAGNEVAHPWTWGRTGMSWYSIHSPIALEYLQMVEGRPPLRPLEDCDLPDRPCRWFIYKDPDAVRPIDYQRMGFRAPVGGGAIGGRRDDVLRLANPMIEVDVDPERGADILAIRRPGGPNILATYDWRSPLRASRSSSYDDGETDWLSEYRGAWQELFPNAGAECEVMGVPLPFHGEVSTARWDVAGSRPEAPSHSRRQLACR